MGSKVHDEDCQVVASGSLWACSLGLNQPVHTAVRYQHLFNPSLANRHDSESDPAVPGHPYCNQKPYSEVVLAPKRPVYRLHPVAPRAALHSPTRYGACGRVLCRVLSHMIDALCMVRAHRVCSCRLACSLSWDGWPFEKKRSSRDPLYPRAPSGRKEASIYEFWLQPNEGNRCILGALGIYCLCPLPHVPSRTKASPELYSL